VLRAAHGPDAAVWAQLRAHGAAQLRSGFAERVLRAARQIPGVPSLLDQFALCVATAALCVAAVLYMHARTARLENERNLASWQQIVLEAQAEDSGA
jgi:hypothetical protein